MSCKTRNRVSCHKRQVSDDDKKYKDGKDKTELE